MSPQCGKTTRMVRSKMWKTGRIASSKCGRIEKSCPLNVEDWKNDNSKCGRLEEKYSVISMCKIERIVSS